VYETFHHQTSNRPRMERGKLLCDDAHEPNRYRIGEGQAPAFITFLVLMQRGSWLFAQRQLIEQRQRPC